MADEVLSGGGWTPALEREREHVLEVDRRVFGAAVGLGVSAGVVAALGVGLVIAGERGRVRRRAEVVPTAARTGRRPATRPVLKGRALAAAVFPGRRK
ncbi:hypothetical protein [Nannocystis pusilla]|uniref:hypothetical protein n=1 Tax=Nannocystis pusilla TaxID=889268 RepID=UPI003B7DE170